MATAARDFTVNTKDGKPGKRRSFKAGEDVPDEWAAVISGKSLLVETADQPDRDPDPDPAEVDLSDYPDDPKVDAVLAWVGDDPARASAALDIETESGTVGGRTTLVTPLRELAGTTGEG